MDALALAHMESVRRLYWSERWDAVNNVPNKALRAAKAAGVLWQRVVWHCGDGQCRHGEIAGLTGECVYVLLDDPLKMNADTAWGRQHVLLLRQCYVEPETVAHLQVLGEQIAFYRDTNPANSAMEAAKRKGKPHRRKSHATQESA